jgi:hypothetical protein
VSPTHELGALAAFYGIWIAPFAERYTEALARYAEWVLERDSFSFVTLGPPADLPVASQHQKLRFERAVSQWPSAITGIKVDAVGQREPTLYVRCVCPWDQGIAWLAREVGSKAYEIPSARTLYGLGFQGNLIKTYSLASQGFISWRVDERVAALERKEYRAEVPWGEISWPDARWRDLGELGTRLGFHTAGHVGRHASTGELKVYVERRGGIPTDNSLA